MSNCIEASIASGFKIKKITMLHKDRRDANDTGSMVCLGTPQTSRLQILWWWYSILTVYNKESWLIIGIEILSPIRFFWVLQSHCFISHTLAARAWIVLCFLQCVIFITLKRGFSGITGMNALTAVCRDRRRSMLRNTSTEEGQIKWKHWERTVCVALLLQCGLGCMLCQALYPSLYAHSLTPSASSSQRTCHTHTHKICTACAHMFLQVLELTQTHTQKK